MHKSQQTVTKGVEALMDDVKTVRGYVMALFDGDEDGAKKNDPEAGTKKMRPGANSATK